MPSQSSRRAADEETPLLWALGLGLWRNLAGNPKEGIAVCLALAGATAVIVNALFLQTGPHPAPFFSTHVPVPRTSGAVPATATGSLAPQLPRPRPTEVEAAPQPAPAPAPQPARQVRSTSGTGPHEDPIAALLLAPSKRVLAVQRVLSQYGYGQISPTGIEDPATIAAVKNFQRRHKLPITGRINEHFVHALAGATGKAIE